MNRLGNVGTFPGISRKGVCRFLEVLGGNLGELAGLDEVSEQTFLPAEITPTLARGAHVSWRVITISPRDLKRSRADELRSILRISLKEKASHSSPSKEIGKQPLLSASHSFEQCLNSS